MVTMQGIDKIIDDIFIRSFKVITFCNYSRYVSPFNIKVVKDELLVHAENEYKNRVPYCDEIIQSLDFISTEIKKANGITKKLYESYHFAFNTIARRFTKIEISDETIVERDNRDSREIETYLASFQDGFYNKNHHQYLDSSAFKFFGREKGTFFEREYNGNGILTKFRIFNVPHPNIFQITSVDLNNLQEEIDKLIRERNSGKMNIDLELPYDSDCFAYEKLAEFNELFGNYAKLNVFSISNHPTFFVEFNEDYLEIVNFFIKSQYEHGIPLKVYYRTDRKFITLRKDGEVDALDFHARDSFLNLDRECPQNFRLDKTSDEKNTYLLLGNSVPKFFAPMIKSYILSKN